MSFIHYKADNNNQFHTKMYENLCKTLFTPEMILHRQNNLERRIKLYYLKKNLQKQKVDHETQYIEYLKELDKENIKYSQEKLIL